MFSSVNHCVNMRKKKLSSWTGWFIVSPSMGKGEICPVEKKNEGKWLKPWENRWRAFARHRILTYGMFWLGCSWLMIAMAATTTTTTKQPCKCHILVRLPREFHVSCSILIYHRGKMEMFHSWNSPCCVR